MADFGSKYTGEQVEALLDQVASGNAGGGGGGGITVETDPIFSNSPAATITEADKSAWGGKQDAISDLATIRSGASKGATSVQPDDIEDFVKSSELADVAYTADYNELENKPTFKTINGESILGSGDIAIAGGSGEVGPQGPQGDKGEKGDTGVGVQSVKQTTTSNVDSGYNVVTVTLTNGTTSTFSVKNGSKGSTGANGTNGVSVSSVKQTTISSADGGTNVVTVTLSNGTTSTFNVKNGSKGSQGIQGIQGEQGPKGDTGATGAQGPKGDKGDTGANGTNGKDGADGEDGATFTPSVDSAGNLSWTNNKGLTNPPTVNIKGPKGDAGEGGGGSSGGEGVIQWTTRYAPDYTNEDGVINLDPFVVYHGGFFPSGGTIYLNSNVDYGEWRIIFYIYPDCSLNFEVDEWVNGITPDISKGGHYELSVVENEDVKLGIVAHFSEE